MHAVKKGKAMANRLGCSSEVWSSELESLHEEADMSPNNGEGSKLSEPSTFVKAPTAASSTDLG